MNRIELADGAREAKMRPASNRRACEDFKRGSGAMELKTDRGNFILLLMILNLLIVLTTLVIYQLYVTLKHEALAKELEIKLDTALTLIKKCCDTKQKGISLLMN